MKQALLLLSIITLLGLSQDVNGQAAKQFPMFEHFTQASCPPCATQNPFFEAVRAENTGYMNHMAVHTSWPGVDPMYSANTTENDAFVSLYGISAVPTMIINGTTATAPAAITQQTVDDISGTSPIRISVEEIDAGGSRDVTISIETVGSAPTGSHVLRAAVVEADVDYGSAPGSNGETFFPNVFRELLTPISGAAYTPAATGSSTSFTYNYTLDPSWDASNVYVIAYIANSGTNAIVNSGATGQPKLEFINATASTFQASAATNTFESDLINVATVGDNVTVTMTLDAPADWAGSFDLMGSNYTSSATVTVGSAATEDLTINVTPGATPALAEVVISVESNDNPDFDPQTIRYYIIHDVTDLVVNNVEGFGDGSPYGTWDWTPLYEGGLTAASNTNFASTGHIPFIKGSDAAALSGVNNIYYNVGWTFPSGSDNKMQALMDFMDNGGNLFISGQDIGWEIMDGGSPYGTTTNQNFYTNYLKASYVSDGADANATATFIDGDFVFDGVGSSAITAVYAGGGQTYMYPDEINPGSPEATGIFHYNTDVSKTGGIRTETSTYKAVYLGIGIEMLNDASIQEAVVRLSHDWFYGKITGLEFDAAIEAITLGNAYPNPANQFALVPLNNVTEEVVFQLQDISGRIVYEEKILPGTSLLELNTADLSAGTYLYYLKGQTGISEGRKLTIND